MANVPLYSKILNGFLEFTGNTLGITTVTSALPIAINALLQATPPPPSGTVIPQANWTTASSAAFLTGKAGSTVDQAFLAWYGAPVPGINGTATALNDPILFTDPTGTTTSIAPNPAWSQDAPFAPQVWITRVADVTSLVSSTGIGKYTVGRIPSAANFTAWTLAVVWRNSSLPYRIITINSFDDIQSTTPISLTITGFSTPVAGTVNGRAVMAVSGAESNTNSGQTQFGPSAGALVPLSGPRNPVGSFFACQICNANSESPTVGQLDTTGTWGTINSTPGANPTVNSRWHFDQTNVSLNAGLTNSQTSGIFRFGPANDPYIVNMIGLQIDTAAPLIMPVAKTVDKTTASVGDTLTYSITFTNTGTASADNVAITDPIPAGTSYVAGSTTANVPFTGDPTTTIDLTNPVAIGETIMVTYQVKVDTQPTPNPIPNTAAVGYTFIPAVGQPPVADSVDSNTVNTLVAAPAIQVAKRVSATTARLGNVLTYTTTVSNSSGISVTGIVLTDPIPSGTTLVPGSVTVNGTPSGDLPNTGITVGALATGTSAVVAFQVTVGNTLPSPNPIPNTATVTSANAPTVTSNTVTTLVFEPSRGVLFI